MNIWIVTAVDYGPSCSGKPVALHVAKSLDEAEAYVKDDMAEYKAKYSPEDIVEFNEAKMSVWMAEDVGCEWSISQFNVEAS